MTPALRIFLNTHLADFSDENRSTFIEKLEEIAGEPFSEFEDAKFVDGCVTFSGRPSPEALQRLAEIYRQRNVDTDDPLHVALRELFAECGVTGIDFGYEHRRDSRDSGSKRREDPLVVFLHGYTGDAATFGQLPKYLKDSFNCRTAIYEYPSSWHRANPSVLALCNNFGNWLRRQGDSREIAIIAHSMGGVLARAWLTAEIYRDERYDERVKLLTLIASPNSGAEIAGILNLLKIGRDRQLQALSPDDFLTDLNIKWAGWLKNVKPKRCLVRTVYGQKDRVVSSTSAAGWDSEATNILEAGHIDIVKPNGENAEIVDVLKHQLSEAGFGLLETSSR